MIYFAFVVCSQIYQILQLYSYFFKSFYDLLENIDPNWLFGFHENPGFATLKRLK
jgi:hypothetical protein